MNSSTGSKTNGALALFFGWIWIIAFLATPVFILWAIFGTGRWYYPLISLAIGGLSNSLCREYKKQAEDMLYESTEKDYASEWIELPEENKKLAVIEAFKSIASKYRPDADINSLISKYEEANRFDDIVCEITIAYEEIGLKEPYQIVCNTFWDKLFLSLSDTK